MDPPLLFTVHQDSASLRFFSRYSCTVFFRALHHCASIFVTLAISAKVPKNSESAAHQCSEVGAIRILSCFMYTYAKFTPPNKINNEQPHVFTLRCCFNCTVYTVHCTLYKLKVQTTLVQNYEKFIHYYIQFTGIIILFCLVKGTVSQDFCFN